MDASTVPPMIYRPDQTAGTGRGGCRTCEHFHGEWIARGVHAVCRLAGRRQVQADPRQGCAFHGRAPGAD